MEMTPMSERDELYDLYSDLYKDAYGVRPRHAAAYTVEELKRAIDALPPPEPTYYDEARELELIPTYGQGWALLSDDLDADRLADDYFAGV